MDLIYVVISSLDFKLGGLLSLYQDSFATALAGEVNAVLWRSHNPPNSSDERRTVDHDWELVSTGRIPPGGRATSTQDICSVRRENDSAGGIRVKAIRTHGRCPSNYFSK